MWLKSECLMHPNTTHRYFNILFIYKSVFITCRFYFIASKDKVVGVTQIYLVPAINIQKQNNCTHLYTCVRLKQKRRRIWKRGSARECSQFKTRIFYYRFQCFKTTSELLFSCIQKQCLFILWTEVFKWLI